MLLLIVSNYLAGNIDLDLHQHHCEGLASHMKNTEGLVCRDTGGSVVSGVCGGFDLILLSICDSIDLCIRSGILSVLGLTFL